MNKKTSKNIKTKFGQRVNQLRMAKKMTQSQLALKCKLSREAISRIERGKKNTYLLTCTDLSEGFGITLKELFNFKY